MIFFFQFQAIGFIIQAIGFINSRLIPVCIQIFSCCTALHLHKLGKATLKLESKMIQILFLNQVSVSLDCFKSKQTHLQTIHSFTLLLIIKNRFTIICKKPEKTPWMYSPAAKGTNSLLNTAGEQITTFEKAGTICIQQLKNGGQKD